MDHVAVLVDDIEATAEAWKLSAAQEIEAFPGAGARELYCRTEGRSARVLLMQPIGPGPYARAMTERGPGLHHVALRVDDVRGFVTSVVGSGWPLHPRSLETVESRRQAWLCRPGFPCLIELSEESVSYEGAHVREGP